MNGKSNIFDVIVVGAGPAGAAAAIRASTSGLRTLLLDSQSTAREKPGETLHPGTEILFDALGLKQRINAAGFVRHAGHFVTINNKSHFYEYGTDHRGDWLGYQAHRVHLAELMVSKATESGVVLSRSETALRVLHDGSRMTGVITNLGMRLASYVIDAAGPRHWLAHQLQLPVLRVSRKLLARYGWVNAKEQILVDATQPHFELKAAAWTWVAPVGACRYAWVSLPLCGGHNELSFVHPVLTRYHPHGRIGYSDVTWRIVRGIAGLGYVIVGDAAWVVDPACSHGVLKALMSGVIAADYISSVLKGNMTWEAARSAYCRWGEAWFCSDAELLASLYALTSPRPDWLSAALEASRYILMNPSA